MKYIQHLLFRINKFAIREGRSFDSNFISCVLEIISLSLTGFTRNEPQLNRLEEFQYAVEMSAVFLFCQCSLSAFGALKIPVPVGVNPVILVQQVLCN